MEEPPMTRPKELLDRIAIERVVTQGVTPEGNASPEATPAAVKVAPGASASPSTTDVSAGQPAAPKDRPPLDGAPSRISGVMPFPGTPAEPSQRQTSIGATANPRTGVPDVPVEVEVKPNGMFTGPTPSIRDKEVLPGRPVAPVDAGQNPGRQAAPVRREPVGGQGASQAEKPFDPGRTVSPRTQEPFKVGETRVYAPETMAGRVATPKILDAIAGVPAAHREKQSYTGTAQVTPQTQVTITVPPAFPYDPKELFAVVDSLIDLPPRRDPTPRRSLSLPTEQLDLESTEAFVARSFTENAGNTSDLDRWNL